MAALRQRITPGKSVLRAGFNTLLVAALSFYTPLKMDELPISFAQMDDSPKST